MNKISELKQNIQSNNKAMKHDVCIAELKKELKKYDEWLKKQFEKQLKKQEEELKKQFEEQLKKKDEELKKQYEVQIGNLGKT
jgi:hypothetical protein